LRELKVKDGSRAFRPVGAGRGHAISRIGR
jgi:hypothetical protein